MKRIGMILIFLLLLSACQPTPETEIVPNRGDDTLQTVIRENGKGFSAAAYKNSLPERWEELLDAGTGAVTVTVNGPVAFPAVDRVPIWETVPGGVDLDAVEKLVQALVPGGYLSKIPVDEFGSAVWTKDRIRAEMEQNRWRMDHARELQPDASQKELDIYLRDLEAANQELMGQVSAGRRRNACAHPGSVCPAGGGVPGRPGPFRPGRPTGGGDNAGVRRDWPPAGAGAPEDHGRRGRGDVRVR